MTRRCVNVGKKKVCTNELNEWSIAKISTETLIQAGITSLLIVIMEAFGWLMLVVQSHSLRSYLEAGIVIVVMFIVSFFFSNILYGYVSNFVTFFTKNRYMRKLWVILFKTLCSTAIFFVISSALYVTGVLELRASNSLVMFSLSLTVVSKSELIMKLIFKGKKKP